MYPASEGSLKETGIPPEFQVKREHQTTHAGGSVYLCPHPKCQTPPFFTQSPAGIYSHIRRKHLGIALACPYCADKVYWNSKGWNSHMNSKHCDAPHFGTALADEAALAQEMLRTTERRAAPSTDAPKKRRVCKKPTRRPQKETPTESSSPSSSSDEGTSDSSSDSSSATSGSSDTEVTGASKPSGRLAKSKPQSSALSDKQMALMMYGASSTSVEPETPSQPRSKILARREAPTAPRPGAAEVAMALVMADVPPDVKPEPSPDPGLEDMPALEEKPPASFPSGWVSAPAKKRRRDEQD